MRYTVTQELKSKTKLNKFLHLSDLFFIVGFFVPMNVLSFIVPKELEDIYMIYNVVVAFSLTLPSPFNSDKKMYNTIFYFFKNKKIVYKAIGEKV